MERYLVVSLFLNYYILIETAFLIQDQFETWAANNKPTKLIKSEFGSPNRDSAIRAFLEAGVSTPLPMSSPTMLDMEDVISESDAKQAMNKMKRVVMKGGESSIRYKNISKKRRKYFSDLYTTLLDTSWFFCVLLFTASFYLSWLMFAIIYFFISYLHGDLLEENLSNPNWTPCIKEVDGFSSSFLFSLETQHTIGYGGRQTTQECPEAVIVVTMQVRYFLFPPLFFSSILLHLRDKNFTYYKPKSYPFKRNIKQT